MPNWKKVVVSGSDAALSSLNVTGTVTAGTFTGLISQSSQVNHDATTNYVANKHIDHTTVSITAGSGLTGGGDISTNRTINVGAGLGMTVNADDIAVDTSSAHFTGGVKSKLNTDSVLSGSVSSPSQGNVTVGGYSTVSLGLRTSDSPTFAGVTATNFTGTASRSTVGEKVDVISGGSTTGLGVYSGSFSGSFIGLNATSGTVTSVGLSLPNIFTVTNSPVTSTGTLTGTLASQTANTVFAAPNGSNGTPTFRSLVAADIPTLNQNTTGNAATVGNLTPTQFFNNMGQNHGTRTSFDATTPSYDFGFRYIQGNGNGPGTGASQYYSWYIGLGNDYPATGAGSYGAMFAINRTPTGGNPYLSVRFNEGNSFGAWTRIYAGYADSAGTATSAATWTTARNFTIGSTARSVDGSGAVSWTLADIGAAASSHTHAISDVTGLQTALDGKLATAGGTITGALTVDNQIYFNIAGSGAQATSTTNYGDTTLILRGPTSGHLQLQPNSTKAGIFLSSSGNIGIDHVQPAYKLDVRNGPIYHRQTTSATGVQWHTQAWIGQYDHVQTAGQYPNYLPGAAYGFHATADSDASFFGLISRGANSNDYNTVIAWGDDADDVLQFRYNNGVVATLSPGGTFNAVQGLQVNGTSVALTNQTMYIGTTAVAINRSSGAQTLTGVSIDGNAATATSATSATTATTATNWGAYGAVPAAGTSFGNANTIGRSDANGYTFFYYINSNTSNSENPTVSQVIVTNGSDNYYRKASIAHLTSAVQSNASGNWSINVTGNAASVTGLTLNSSANGINPDNVTQNQIGYNTSVSLFGQTDGGLYSSTYSSAWIHQIYGDFRTGQIAIRGKNNGTWQAWRTVLDSSNYSSYALPLSGGTLTGGLTVQDSTSAITLASGYTIGMGDWGLRNTTPYGWIQFGPANTSWAHIYSNRTFYFNQELYVNGNQVLHAGNYNSYSPTLTGGNASGTWGINVTGYSTYFPTNYIGGQQLNPQTYFGQSVGLRVAMTAVAGYWSDTLWINGYSGGDVLSMCALHTSRQGSPRMWISYQNSNASSYGTIYEFLTENNYSSWAVARGGDTTSGQFVWNGSQTWNAASYFVANRNTDSSNPPLQAYSSNGGGAIMSFHRGGYYAVNMGLDSDNVFRIGGWSAGANRFQLDMSGNGTFASSVTATTVYGNDVYTTGGWFRNHTNSNGIYWSQTGWHLYPSSASDFFVRSGADGGTLRLLKSDGTTYGYLHWAADRAMGFLTDGGSWRLRVDNSRNLGYVYNINADADITAGSAMYSYNWFRSYNATGWYNQSYGGGIWMNDSSWVKVYGTFGFYATAQIAAVGDITAFYSDERLKTRVGRIDNALEKVMSLEGFLYVENDLARSFGYKNTKQQVGISAQRVKAILPEVVSLAPFDIKTDPETGEFSSMSGQDYLTVKYERLVPLLIEAIKEQQAEISNLKQQIKTLLD